MSANVDPKLAELRKEYRLRELREGDVDANPLAQFQQWFAEACRSGVPEPNAMTLATSDCEGRVSARIVLLKGCDARGFSFFTNYQSRKGHELAENPRAALVFFWAELERQIRVEGRVQWLSAEESETYFHSRPRNSQLAAWASAQSESITTRESLEQKFEATSRAYEGREVARPPHWGGFLVVPESIEFWQGRPSRLHDRLRYDATPAGSWVLKRLAP